MKQGDIILIDFDPTKGREQAGYRPALVISQTKFNKKRNLALICPITSNSKPLNFRVALDERTQIKGDILCEQVRTIDLLVRKHKFVESAPSDLLEKVLDAVSVIINFEN
ncbi:MAG: type II toxin-antitoxin system PemK/MazF family toxin [Defluviitaleaceae bacterium]|nr:type II toxin-antitoxin system PemK/MazF family toxin [Defluviitaleaceae bacterium]